jgi:hypothetical protein
MQTKIVVSSTDLAMMDMTQWDERTMEAKGLVQWLMYAAQRFWVQQKLIGTNGLIERFSATRDGYSHYLTELTRMSEALWNVSVTQKADLYMLDTLSSFHKTLMEHQDNLQSFGTFRANLPEFFSERRIPKLIWRWSDFLVIFSAAGMIAITAARFWWRLNHMKPAAIAARAAQARKRKRAAR